MSNIPNPPEKPSSPLSRFTHQIRRLDRSLSDGLFAFEADLRNGIKHIRKAQLDYVVLPVGGSLPERDGPKRGFIERRLLPLPADPLSLQQLNERLRAVMDADNARGVIFVFQGFKAGLATLQNFRSAVARLRAEGKEAIVYTPYLDLPHYYAATAADRIVAPPGAQFEVLGLYTEVTFLKDTLSRAGIQADVVQISPYKTAFDRFSRSDITPENREQLDWLLDDEFDVLTTGMAAGCGISQDTMRRYIDQAPFSVERARDLGLIDHIAYDDQLAEWLGGNTGSTSTKNEVSGVSEGANGAGTDKESKRPTAKLKTWKESRRILYERPRRRTRRFVGVISLEGLITMGPSRTPPIELPIPIVGGATAGEQTLVSLLRRAEKLPDMAALVIHVDSGGGSALASDLIGRQIELLAAKKPVVIYMGNVAASGGYYVAAPARHIMSQQSSITGSIGVITARFSFSGLYDQLSINQISLERGEHAGLFRSTTPWSEAERDLSREMVENIYDQFRDIVVRNRGLTPEQVDAVGLGRVWTGRQALSHRLVDSNGDFLDAIKKAAELAALPTEDVYAISVVNIYPRSSSYTIPAVHSSQIIEEIRRLLVGEHLSALNGQPLFLLPYDLRFR